MDQMGRFCCYIFIILVCVQASIIPPCSACLEEDQNALLLLINYPIESFSPSSNLITNKEIHATDCCNWTGVVKCSNITGRVTLIDLDELLYSWSSIGSEYWYLNTSLFLPFQELKSLYLYGYRYNLRVSKEGLERLSGLTKLEELYLNYIPFNESILPSLAKIVTLKILSLSRMKEWDYEAANNSQGFERLSALSKLEELYLDFNDFNETILPSLGKIASLKKLSLSNNKITGRVPINKGFTMSKLEELNLDGNKNTGVVFG
ncbi:hypothetical protein F2P56_023216 [Juglans regia]|uniref:Uncharacterized protein n=1 Tax=Juglans regia TaxID=51240 RepID=A0A833U1W7_JUGRE|nr:hypothetical protein F2P56_023216 [Juglans regia]